MHDHLDWTQESWDHFHADHATRLMEFMRRSVMTPEEAAELLSMPVEEATSELERRGIIEIHGYPRAAVRAASRIGQIPDRELVDEEDE